MSVAVLLGSKENPVIYKGPRKTNLIKKILKETFWGKLDYLICDTPPGKYVFKSASSGYKTTYASTI